MFFCLRSRIVTIHCYKVLYAVRPANVHTVHSGMCTIPLLNRICRESYNDPHEVYALLKRRGMDLVTVTDHDSIDAVAEPLRRHTDFFLSEEVSCSPAAEPGLHIGVYGIVEERDHTDRAVPRQ